MKNLLGGKGANLAEMANIGLPVPAGFTITTEVCTEFYAGGKKLPKALDAEIRALDRAAWRRSWAPSSAIAEPAAGLVPLGRARLDAGHDGHDPEPRPQRQDRRRPGREVRQRALRLGQLPPLRRDVRRRRARPEAREQGGPRSVRRDPARPRRRQRGVKLDSELPADALKELVAEFKAEIKKRIGKDFPDDPVRAAGGRHQGRVPVVEERPRHRLPPAVRHPGRVGHGRQRPGDGVRQHGRRLGDRRRLHARPGHRRERLLRRVPHQRPGRGRRRRHPHAARRSRRSAR